MNCLNVSILLCVAFLLNVNCNPDVSDSFQVSAEEGPCDDVSVKLTCGCKPDPSGWCKYFGSECHLNEYNRRENESELR